MTADSLELVYRVLPVPRSTCKPTRQTNLWKRWVTGFCLVSYGRPSRTVFGTVLRAGFGPNVSCKESTVEIVSHHGCEYLQVSSNKPFSRILTETCKAQCRSTCGFHTARWLVEVSSYVPPHSTLVGRDCADETAMEFERVFAVISPFVCVCDFWNGIKFTSRA